MSKENIKKRFEDELGELNEDDKEVLEDTIKFEETSNKIRDLF